jgi:hypothetical protein
VPLAGELPVKVNDSEKEKPKTSVSVRRVKGSGAEEYPEEPLVLKITVCCEV